MVDVSNWEPPQLRDRLGGIVGGVVRVATTSFVNDIGGDGVMHRGEPMPPG